METLQLDIANQIAVLRLDRGRANPINRQLIQELTTCVQQLEQDDKVSAVILTGKEGFFSSGIDLIEVYGYDEEQIRGFWTDFLNMQTVLASFRKPMVAALSGHSPAGGCIIALCADHVLMQEGKYIIGLNEVPVGIIVPESVFHLYAFWLGKRKAYQYLLEGKLMNPDEAKNAGLVNEVVPADQLMDAAFKKAHQYTNFNANTWQQSKQNLRRELIAQLSADQSDVLEAMLQQWWAPETRKGLEMMITQLKAKAK